MRLGCEEKGNKMARNVRQQSSHAGSNAQPERKQEAENTKSRKALARSKKYAIGETR